MSIDTYGQRISEVYRIIHEPSFERRLKAFDPALRLMFNQKDERWVVLEWALDNSGWNVLIKAEWPNDKSPRPLGDWVFEKLHKKRQINDLKHRLGTNVWFNGLVSEAQSYKQKEKEKASAEHQAMIRDDLLQWRKASKELQNLPVSDATAGYPKVNYANV